jgi:type IV pilus assembly protein PilQ
MRRAKSLICAALLRRSAATLVAAGAASGVLLCERAALAESMKNHVQDVRVHEDPAVPGGAQIEISGTAPFAYNVRVADGGRRLLVDLSDADVTGAPAAITTATGVVGGVLTQGFDTDAGAMARVSVSLQREATYRVVPDGNTLKVLLAPSAKAGTPGAPGSPAAPAAPAGGPAGAPGAGAGAAAATAGTKGPSAPSTSSTSPTIVRDIRFERSSAGSPGCAYGCDRVVVELARMPAYSLTTSPEGRLRLELRDTSLPEAFARTVDVSPYHGALKSVTALGGSGAEVAAALEIERAGDAAGTVSVDGTTLTWSFPLSKPAAQVPAPVALAAPIHFDGRQAGRDGGVVRHVVTVAREEIPDLPKIETSVEGTPGIESSGGGASGFFDSTAGGVLAQQHYTGRRIDIDLKDADIHNILRLLADTGHMNIVTSDNVGGTITIRMRNVPWDQVLDTVLQAKGLGMVRIGNLVRVAPLSDLEKERELRLAQLKQEYDLTPLETRLIPISFANATELSGRARDLLSPRGSVSVDARTNVLVARDIGPNLNYVEELIRSLDTQTPQVLIEARIVESTSQFAHEVGIQWGGDVTFGPSTGNPTGAQFPSSVGVAGGTTDGATPTAGLSPFTSAVANPNFVVNMPAPVGTGSGGALGFAFGSLDNNLTLNLRLTAAESSGLVRIVSAPRIMVLDNRPARINQGTQIPFSQVSALGVQTTFQEARLQLFVTPHVTAEGSISLHVKVNRDEPDFGRTAANGQPTILRREAETDLLVMDGHTAVIGGIYTRNTGRNYDAVPFFADIPILGILFQHNRSTDVRTELMIFITPRIVNRAEALGR